METSRNQPCPCGSGKKYKRCCGAKDCPTDAQDGTDRSESGDGPASALVRFAEPLLQRAGDDQESKQKALTLALVFWNMAIFPDDGAREELMESLVRPDGPFKTEEDRQYIRAMAERMIERHQQMFPGLHPAHAR